MSFAVWVSVQEIGARNVAVFNMPADWNFTKSMREIRAVPVSIT